MFKAARLKLTLWYLLIIALVSLFFSSLVYKSLTRELDRFAHLQQQRFERRLFNNATKPPRPEEPPYVDLELINESKKRLLVELGVINFAVITMSGVFGYFLAGKTLRPIQLMLEKQNNFISDASHEIKTPLTSLKSSMEVFLRDENSNMTDAKKLIQESISEVDLLTHLTNTLLKSSQYQENASVLENREVINIYELVTLCITRLSGKATNKNIRVDFSMHNKNANIMGNRVSILELFYNVLDNAIKYSHANSVVLIEAETNNTNVLVNIKDTGVGISAEQLEHVFDRFYRADSSRSKTNVDGFGLGLSIAQDIAQLHKGDIRINSELNKGTVVTITLPLHNRS